VSSHAHYDHVGGIAALQRASGAVVAASSASAAALRAAVSADGYRFTGSDTHPSIVDSFRESIRTVAALPCDILLSPHAGFFAMSSKLQQRREGRADAFVNGDDCRSYASAAGERLEQRIVEERAR
jgi:metallo-beta-lactamase class B